MRILIHKDTDANGINGPRLPSNESGVFARQDQSEELIAELERALDEGNFNIALHAQERARRVGSVSLINSVIRPLADLVRQPAINNQADPAGVGQ